MQQLFTLVLNVLIKRVMSTGALGYALKDNLRQVLTILHGIHSQYHKTSLLYIVI